MLIIDTMHSHVYQANIDTYHLLKVGESVRGGAHVTNIVSIWGSSTCIKETKFFFKKLANPREGQCTQVHQISTFCNLEMLNVC